MYTKIVLAYFAGIMDGEGWFSIQKTKRKDRGRSPSYVPTIGVGSSDKVLTDWLEKYFGGKVRYRIHHHQIGKKPIYEWRPSWGLIKPVIPKIIPYLVIKPDRAKLLMELDKLSSNKFRGKGIPKENLLKREKIYLKIRELNNICPAAETKRKDILIKDEAIVRSAWKHAEIGRNDLFNM